MVVVVAPGMDPGVVVEAVVVVLGCAAAVPAKKEASVALAIKELAASASFDRSRAAWSPSLHCPTRHHLRLILAPECVKEFLEL